jgi:hypothetical protein
LMHQHLFTFQSVLIACTSVGGKQSKQGRFNKYL